LTLPRKFYFQTPSKNGGITPAAGKKSFPAGNGKSVSTRTRRSKKEAIALKKLLKAERKAGVPVAELAKKHGISTAYIYMLR
jgi:hypothetical protein